VKGFRVVSYGVLLTAGFWTVRKILGFGSKLPVEQSYADESNGRCGGGFIGR